MRHTIDEAASLVGRTRRSLYRAMTEGRLSYGVDGERNLIKVRWQHSAPLRCH